MVLTPPRWETPTPPKVAGSYGPAVRKWARRRLGITFGPWQAYVMDGMLRHDANGDLIARVALVSTARQNGKSVIVRAFFGWLLDEGQYLPPFAGWRSILAAAHDAKQARIIYRGVLGDLLTLDDLVEKTKGRNSPVRLTEYFGITVGRLTLDTITSDPGSTRGISAGAVAFDEVLTQRDFDMWEAVSPTQSAQRSPIMVLTSTAGHVDSVVLRTFYDRLVRIASGDEKPDPAFYGVWWQTADPDVQLDWTALRQSNPGLGDGRLTRAAIKAEHGWMPPESWQRERLNHFVDAKVETAFRPGVWSRCRTPSPLDVDHGPFAVGVDVQPGWDRATISVAGVRPDGRIGAVIYRELVEDVTAERIIDTVHGFPGLDQTVAIVYDTASGGAAAFARAATEVGWPWVGLKPHELVAASMDVTELILSGRLAVNDPVLDAQVAVTGRRDVGQDGAFRFSRAHSGGAIDAFLSMTMAAHTIAKHAAPSIYVPETARTTAE